MVAFLMSIAFVITAGLAGCAEMPQLPMTAAQAVAYNQCMSHRWSTLADSALFGVAGYEYHQNTVLACQQAALITPQATTGQPVSAGNVTQPTSRS